VQVRSFTTACLFEWMPRHLRSLCKDRASPKLKFLKSAAFGKRTAVRMLLSTEAHVANRASYPLLLLYHRNRYLKISGVPLKSQVQGISLFTSIATNQRVGHGKLRSNFQRVRRYRVAIKLGVIQGETGRMDDRMSQGKSFWRDDS